MALGRKIIPFVLIWIIKIHLIFFKRDQEKKSSSPGRIAPFHLVRHLESFPYSGRLCTVHLREIYSIIKHKRSVVDELSAMSGIHSYEMEVEKADNLEESPLKSHTTIPLQQQTSSAVRRLTAKLRRVISAAGRGLCRRLSRRRLKTFNIFRSVGGSWRVFGSQRQ